MRRTVALLLLLSLFGMIFPNAMQAASVPSLYLNGALIATESQPRIVNDSTMVPIRVVAEQLGYKVTWMQKEKQVDIRSESNRILLKINADEAEVNGEAKQLDTPAYVDVNVTYVPLRFIGEHMGLDVYWDQPTRSVHLYGSPPADESAEQPDGTIDSDQPIDGGEIVLPPIPADARAVVKSVGFDGVGRITVRYDGELMPGEPFWSGTKLVIDIPYASLDPAIMADLAQRKVSQGEVVIDTLSLDKVRYSYFSNNPSTVRLVFDLIIKQEYTVSYGEQEYYVDIALTEPPALPETPVGAGSFKVVIDAGHGGKDPGAPSLNGRWEKEFNLAIARKLNAILEQEEGITPYMTRSTDVFLELADRAAFANDLGADIFISIHANRYTKSSVRGAETYYNRPDSEALANTLHKHLLSGTGLPDRGVRKANFHVIRETVMPAVLLECGYLSNSLDVKALYTESVQNRIAQEIAAGIKSYAAAKGRK